jgi:hypothetical protein
MQLLEEKSIRPTPIRGVRQRAPYLADPDAEKFGTR